MILQQKMKIIRLILGLKNVILQVKGGPTEMGCSYPPTHGNQPSPTCKNIHEQVRR